MPVPPLDGSKVLFAFLPYYWQKYRFALERYSFLLVLLLITIPAFSRILSSFIVTIFTLITGQPLMLG
jgi:Zn-dependent protease